MAIKNIITAAAFFGICFISCTRSEKTGSAIKDTVINSNNMNSYISMVEIPATDISRAVNFYHAILGLTIETMEIPEMQIGIFPYESQVVSVVIVKADGYQPSADGVTTYLNGGDDLQLILNKVEENGGKILTLKTPHADESGYFALFLDSEGNKIGLHSAN